MVIIYNKKLNTDFSRLHWCEDNHTFSLFNKNTISSVL